MVASELFSCVMFYTADVESGVIRSKVGRNFYARKKTQPFVLNPLLNTSEDLISAVTSCVVTCQIVICSDIGPSHLIGLQFIYVTYLQSALKITPL